MEKKEWGSIGIRESTIQITNKKLEKDKKMQSRNIHKTGDLCKEIIKLYNNDRLELMMAFEEKLSKENLEKVLEFINRLEK